SNLPGNLTRLEVVSLRRVRVNAEITPAVRARWGHTTASSCCHFCPTAVREADLGHLLWIFPGLQVTRRRHLSRVDLHPYRSSDFQRLRRSPHRRSLLDLFWETGI
ncbi:hypothetical protein HPB47_026324, partial [Ixodes persulcatus]